MYDYIFMLCFCYFCSFLSELDSATLTALDIDLEMEIAPEAVHQERRPRQKVSQHEQRCRQKVKHAPNRQIGELPDSPPAPQQDADALINRQTSLFVDLFCPYFLILKFNPIPSTPRPPKNKDNQTTPLGFGSSADLVDFDFKYCMTFSLIFKKLGKQCRQLILIHSYIHLMNVFLYQCISSDSHSLCDGQNVSRQNWGNTQSKCIRSQRGVLECRL